MRLKEVLMGQMRMRRSWALFGALVMLAYALALTLSLDVMAAYADEGVGGDAKTAALSDAIETQGEEAVEEATVVELDGSEPVAAVTEEIAVSDEEIDGGITEVTASTDFDADQDTSGATSADVVATESNDAIGQTEGVEKVEDSSKETVVASAVAKEGAADHATAIAESPKTEAMTAEAETSKTAPAKQADAEQTATQSDAAVATTATEAKTASAGKAASAKTASADKAASAKTTQSKKTTALSTQAAKAKTYTVKFYDVFGNIIKTQKVAKGKNATAPKKASMYMYGRTFKGWSVSLKKVSGNLYAHPVYKDKAEVYYLTVDYSDASTGSTTKYTSKVKAGVEAPITYFTVGGMGMPAGKVLTGYSTQANGKGTVYNAGEQFKMPASDMILYPVYKKAKKGLTLTYNLKNAHNAETGYVSTSMQKGDQVVLGGGSITSENGWTLVGYSTKANGKGKVYNLGDTYTMPKKSATLYGVWKKNTTTLKLVGNYKGGTSAIYYVPAGVSLPLNSYNTSMFSPDYRSRDGYVLKAYTTKANGKGTKYNVLQQDSYTDGSSPYAYVTVPKKGLTLYAQWAKNKITYKPNYKGETDGAKTPNESPTSIVTSIASGHYFNRDGYTLVGWATKSNGKGVTYVPGSYVPAVKKNLTLYAVWKKNASTITLQYNNDGKAVDTQKAFKGTDLYLSNASGKDGYYFTGWNTKKNGKGITYQGRMVVPKGKTTLYAQWKKAVKLTYNYNGNGESSYTRYVKPKTIQTVNGETPSRDGYVFAGWTLKKTGKGKVYTYGDTLKVSKNRTLYAKWVKASLTITLNYNGGQDYDNNTGKYVKSAKVKAAKGYQMPYNSKAYPSRDGYTLIGWNTKKNGKGTQYSRYELYSVNSVNSFNTITPFKPKKSTTLYAQWAKAPTMTVYCNIKGNSDTATEHLDYGKRFDSDYWWTNGKKVLAGFNTKANGKGTAFAMGDYLASAPAAGLKVYAQWKTGNRTLTFNGNGKAANKTVKAIAGAYVYVRTPDSYDMKSKDKAYYFDSWNKKKNGKGEEVLSYGNLVYVTKNATYAYAQWGKKATVKFNANGGKGSPASKYVAPKYPDNSFDLSGVSGEVSRADYTLKGWARTKGATMPDFSTYDNVYVSDSEYADLPYPGNGKTTTLYAVWAENPKVIFNANGGTGSLVENHIEPYNYLWLDEASSSVSRDDYTLQGWSTSNNGSVAYATNDSIYAEDIGEGNSLNLYAIWAENPKITFDANGGSGSYAAQHVSPDGQFKLNDVSGFVRDGYSLIGWSKTPGGSAEYTDTDLIYGSDIGVGNTVTLYAVWEQDA